MMDRFCVDSKILIEIIQIEKLFIKIKFPENGIYDQTNIFKIALKTFNFI